MQGTDRASSYPERLWNAKPGQGGSLQLFVYSAKDLEFFLGIM